jgi:hypothetical protein
MLSLGDCQGSDAGAAGSLVIGVGLLPCALALGLGGHGAVGAEAARAAKEVAGLAREVERTMAAETGIMHRDSIEAINGYVKGQAGLRSWRTSDPRKPFSGGTGL